MGNISPRVRAMSPRSLRDRLSRTPRDSASTPPPAPPDEPYITTEDEEFAELCERLRNVFRQPAFGAPLNTTPEPASDADSSLSSTPADYHQLTASGVHRLRVSIASRLPVDEANSSFWRMTLSPGRA